MVQKYLKHTEPTEDQLNEIKGYLEKHGVKPTEKVLKAAWHIYLAGMMG